VAYRSELEVGGMDVLRLSVLTKGGCHCSITTAERSVCLAVAKLMAVLLDVTPVIRAIAVIYVISTLFQPLEQTA
jgi:hypothetical protein